jgi:hypothetical protein
MLAPACERKAASMTANDLAYLNGQTAAHHPEE